METKKNKGGRPRLGRIKIQAYVLPETDKIIRELSVSVPRGHVVDAAVEKLTTVDIANLKKGPSGRDIL